MWIRSSVIYRAARLGAILVMAGGLAAALIVRWEGGVSFQPGETQATAQEVSRLFARHATGAIWFLAADTILAAGYLTVFVGLHAATAARCPRLSRIALIAGLLMGLADLLENAIYFGCAISGLKGSPIAPDLDRIRVVTDLKEAGVGAAYLLFALALPWRERPGRWIGSAMLLAPLVGFTGVFFPVLIGARGWTVILPAPLWLVWLRPERLRATDS